MSQKSNEMQNSLEKGIGKRGHVPVRRCIACGARKDKSMLIKIVWNEGRYRLDGKHKMDGRSIYLCKEKECLKKCYSNKKIKLDIELLSEAAKEIDKSTINLKGILELIKRSGKVVFGYEMTYNALVEKKVFLVIAANDILDKQLLKIEEICGVNNVKLIKSGLKTEYGALFGKSEVNMLGITDEKSAVGIIKRFGGG